MRDERLACLPLLVATPACWTRLYHSLVTSSQDGSYYCKHATSGVGWMLLPTANDDALFIMPPQQRTGLDGQTFVAWRRRFEKRLFLCPFYHRFLWRQRNFITKHFLGASARSAGGTLLHDGGARNPYTHILQQPTLPGSSCLPYLPTFLFHCDERDSTADITRPCFTHAGQTQHGFRWVLGMP